MFIAPSKGRIKQFNKLLRREEMFLTENVLDNFLLQLFKFGLWKSPKNLEINN